MKSADIVKILDEIFPLKDGLKWDKNGKNFYFDNDNIDKCLVTLDIDSETLNYALENKIKFIITHHPIKFLDYAKEIKDPVKKKLFKIIKTEKITCYALHTNYDVNKLGMNYRILEQLNAKNIKKISDNDTPFFGILEKEMSMKNLISFFKKTIKNLDHIQYIGDLNTLNKNIAICAGSGKSSVPILPDNTDIFITGELTWYNLIALKEKNIRTLILGHYMESYFINEICNILKNNLKNVNIIDNNKNNILKVLKF